MNKPIVNGKVLKRAHCPSCFSLVSWDTSKAEKNGLIECPNCHGAIKCNTAEIIISNLIEEKDIAAVINGIAYTSENLIEGVKEVAAQGGEITFNSDLALKEDITFENVDAVINLEDCALDLGVQNFKFRNSTITINGTKDSVIKGQSDNSLFSIKNSKVTLNNGNYETNKWGFLPFESSKLILNEIKMEAKEACVTVYSNSSVTINNCELTSTDNYVVGTQGSKEEENTKKYITINNSVLNGKITTTGYLSCGIYSVSDAKVIINDSTINSNAGCGILMRAGEVQCNGTEINAKGTNEGKIGDGKALIACDGIAYDAKSNYPCKDTLKLVIDKNTQITAENGQRIGYYLGEEDTANIIDNGK